MEEKNKIKITIAGNEFKLRTSEGEEYTRQLAKTVDKEITEMCLNSTTVSVTAAAILTALNFCDKNKKYEKDAENLSLQLRDYLEALTAERNRNAHLLSEIERLKTDIEMLRSRLSADCPTINEVYPISSSVKPLRRDVFMSDNEEAAEDGQIFFENMPELDIKDASSKETDRNNHSEESEKINVLPEESEITQIEQIPDQTYTADSDRKKASPSDSDGDYVQYSDMQGLYVPKKTVDSRTSPVKKNSPYIYNIKK